MTPHRGLCGLPCEVWRIAVIAVKCCKSLYQEHWSVCHLRIVDSFPSWVTLPSLSDKHLRYLTAHDLQFGLYCKWYISKASERGDTSRLRVIEGGPVALCTHIHKTRIHPTCAAISQNSASKEIFALNEQWELKHMLTMMSNFSFSASFIAFSRTAVNRYLPR